MRAAAAQLRSAGVAAVAVCFVHAYRYDAHEKRAGEILRQELPGMRFPAMSRCLHINALRAAAADVS
ncbi:hypothetical protein NKH93_22060 [Mesorhizobium sp. M0954]